MDPNQYRNSPTYGNSPPPPPPAQQHYYPHNYEGGPPQSHSPVNLPPNQPIYPQVYNPPPPTNPSYPHVYGGISAGNNQSMLGGHPNQQPVQRGGGHIFEDLGARDQFISQVPNPIAQMGLQYGGKIFDSGIEYVDQKFGRYISSGILKYYFNVNNSYVLNKIKLLLCPLLHRSWKRRMVRTANGDQFLPPRDDLNAPDLYIPTMALVTYILAVAFVYGTVDKFTPEVLGMTASTSLVLLALEILFIKGGFYVTNAANISFIDIAAYSSYKYVPTVVSILGGFFLGRYIYYLITLSLGIFMTIFMVKTLRVVLLAETSGTSMDMQSQTSRNYLLLLVGLLQPILIYFLSVYV
eukprot:TRINITY_DN5396_c0_g1_i4.p1 TRINITY_DN5396_c0_g1~~TRINITY_DN5396_c0_g1_i4.p1  ORF type:complete len:352 (-),score=52.12 TRINITY_DN5396_c0_g1_i4:119-1174(-)